MSKPSFTPGPWVVEKAADAYCIASIGSLAIMPAGGRVKHDNTAADARLIASAPDLLEALLIATSKPLAQHCTDEEWAVIRSAIMGAQGDQP